MSYVDEMIDLVVRENPNEPEFHQAVREVLNSLRPVVESLKNTIPDRRRWSWIFGCPTRNAKAATSMIHLPVCFQTTEKVENRNSFEFYPEYL